jgi:hypothetical protein
MGDKFFLLLCRTIWIKVLPHMSVSSVAQRKRVGLITQRSEDRNLVELIVRCDTE